MTRALIMHSTREDVAFIAEHMRESDRQEVHAASGSSPVDAVVHGFERSVRSYTLTADSVPVAMFGVVPLSGAVGVPWMLGTDRMPDELRRFSGCEVKNVLRSYLRIFEVLVNYVDARNAVAVAWLKRRGAVLFDPVPYGAFDLPFHRFEFRRGL